MAKNKQLGEVLIINEELLKLYSPLPKNISVDKVYPFLQLAQPFYITPILGDALMSELQDQVSTNTLTDDNKALVIKCAMPLAYRATFLALRSLAYSVTEKSITLEHSENSQPISEKELSEYILNISDQCEMAETLLIKYLCRCQELYPLWKPQSECDCSKYLPTDGSTKNKLDFLIYFPTKWNPDDGCFCNKNFYRF